MTERITSKDLREMKKDIKSKYDLNDAYFKRFELLNSNNRALLFKELIYLKIYYDINEKLIIKALINKYHNIQHYKRVYLTDFNNIYKFYEIYKLYDIWKDKDEED